MDQDARDDLLTLDSHLGPVLETYGFAGAQIYVEQASATALYCAAREDISTHNPALFDDQGQPAQPGECYDVTVHVTEGRLLNVRTEGEDLIETLSDQGITAHEKAVRASLGSPVDKAAAPVAQAFRALFASHEDR